ncbi:hypothetical protein SAMN05518856_103221 [Paenibacillus sp. OK003]|nr:hypothetical protein SAMN05518856_103221 [Paenibacillus sp. OK003]
MRPLLIRKRKLIFEQQLQIFLLHEEKTGKILIN